MIFFKDFSKIRTHKHSHVGLGVTAENICEVLRSHSVDATAVGVTTPEEVEAVLAQAASNRRLPTCVVISAFWIATPTLKKLCLAYPSIQFTATCHSNVGFLQTEPAAIKLMYEALTLSRDVPNFLLSGNSQPFKDFVSRVTGIQCLWLPNLYDVRHLKQEPVAPWKSGRILRIGCFGALRAQKNVVTAAGAALAAAAELGADTEFWVSTGRDDGGGANTILQAIRELLLPSKVRLVENGWQDWKGFKKTVGRMHVLVQPSYTESWNVVTADGIAEGVPSVVSTAIRWAPANWKADSDDACDLARKLVHFVKNPHVVHEGRAALVDFVTRGIRLWKLWATP
jgi:glycosyltransferase involved in cell wall biosynthesis